MKPKSYKIIMILAIIIPVLNGIIGGSSVFVRFELQKRFFRELLVYVNPIIYGTIAIIIFFLLHFILKILNKIRLKLEKIDENEKN